MKIVLFLFCISSTITTLCETNNTSSITQSIDNTTSKTSLVSHYFQKIKNKIQALPKLKPETEARICKMMVGIGLVAYYAIHIQHHRALEDNSLVLAITSGLFEGTLRLTAAAALLTFAIVLKSISNNHFDVTYSLSSSLKEILAPASS